MRFLFMWAFMKRSAMKSILKNLIVAIGLLVLLTHSSSAQWTAVDSGLPAGTYVYSFAFSGGNIFAGTNSGVFLSTNNGTSWNVVNSGLPANSYVWSLALCVGNIFAGTNGGVFLSTNNGTSWTVVNNGLTNTSVPSLAVIGLNIFAGTSGGVFLSANNGATWTVLNGTPGTLFVGATCLAVSGSYIFAGTEGGGVVLSTDIGKTWATANMGLTNGDVHTLAVNGGNIFAGTMSGGTGEIGSIFLSTDSGTSWAAVDSGFPANTSVLSLAVSGNTILAGTDSGVFLSTNNGASWTAVGLPNTWVPSLAVIGSTIFAGTYGGGIWRRPLSEVVGVINDKSHQGTSGLYSNGFKINISKNNISVLLPTTLTNGNISVELYTTAGKRIYWATHNAYNAILRIPISGLSTGTYLISITNGRTSLASSVLLTR